MDLAAHAAVDGSPDALRGLTVYARQDEWYIFRLTRMGLRYDPLDGLYHDPEGQTTYYLV